LPVTFVSVCIGEIAADQLATRGHVGRRNKAAPKIVLPLTGGMAFGTKALPVVLPGKGHRFRLRMIAVSVGIPISIVHDCIGKRYDENDHRPEEKCREINHQRRHESSNSPRCWGNEISPASALSGTG
jgi:hypothetical protein